MTDVSRRSIFSQMFASTTAFYMFGGLALAKASDDPVREIYDRAISIDSLTPGRVSATDATSVIRAGLTACVLDLKASPRDYQHAMEAIALTTAEVSQPRSPTLIVRKAGDIIEAKRRGKLGIILDCQDASILGPDSIANDDSNLEALRAFFDKGLRVLQLTYTNANALGSGYQEREDAGLTRLGQIVTSEMNRLGMLIDLSHCGDRTTLEAIKLSTKPVAVTHAGCRSLYDDKRNKPDEIIRTLAERGGYFGVYNMTMWLTDSTTSSVEDIVDHIDHVVRVGGIEIAGFGSDGPVVGDNRPQSAKVRRMTDGFVKRNAGWPGGRAMTGHMTATDLDGPDRMSVLASALGRRGYKAAAVEKVIGGNFVRVFGQACG